MRKWIIEFIGMTPIIGILIIALNMDNYRGLGEWRGWVCLTVLVVGIRIRDILKSKFPEE